MLENYDDNIEFDFDQDDQDDKKDIDLNYAKKLEKRFALVKYFILFVTLISITGVVYYFYKDNEKKSYDILTAIDSEAALFESEPERLALISDDSDKIKNYFDSHKDISFTPKLILNFDKDYKIYGSTVIHYEENKDRFDIGIVAHKNDKDQWLYQFMFKGDFKDIENKHIGKYEDIDFKTFSSGDRNVIVWQLNKNTLSAFIGKESSVKLASYANHK